MTDAYIKGLISYALTHGLIEPADGVYCTNAILQLMRLDAVSDDTPPADDVPLETILNALCDDAVARGVIEDGITYRDLFDTALMGALTPRPSQVIERFNALYKEDPRKATDDYYRFSCDTNYIRRDRIKKDLKWQYTGEYGTLDITINLSKPEKDPKAIAAAKNAPQAGYPKCQLCRESEGYAGRVNFPHGRTTASSPSASRARRGFSSIPPTCTITSTVSCSTPATRPW